ncbi:MAG: CotH kinase family protein [Actinomycetota bacterium]|nr:CotH kinase family protein [Actinomycetota bacterium]
MRTSTVKTFFAVISLSASALVMATAPASAAPDTSSVHALATAVTPAAPTVSKDPALVGEKVTLSGDIGTPVVRTVVLQKLGSSWTTYATSKTLADGTYSFTASTTAPSRQFRVFAQAEGGNEALTSAPATINTVPDAASLSIARDGGDAKVTGTFTPKVPGRLVALQYKSGSSWKALGSKVAEDADGKIQTTFSLTGLSQWSTRSYRLVADAVNGSSTATSPTIKFMPGPTQLSSKVIRVTTNKNVAVTSKSGVYPGVATLNGGAPMALETLGLHGNSTAKLAKKPYKLKFIDKQKAFAESFGMKSDRTFILLAHFIDPSGVRDKVGYDLGTSLKDTLKWTPRNAYTEVFVNDEYMGSYLLVESIKIDSNRVNVSKTKGIVVEVDGRSVSSSKFGFMSPHKFPMTFKDPDEVKPAPNEAEGYTPAKLAALKARVTAFESALYGSNRADPVDGYAKYLDVPSSIDYYLIKEFTKDNDSDFYRSIFYSWNDSTDPASRFAMGPVWDFDRSAGVITGDATASSSSGWRMRGIGSTHNPNNATHWYVQLFKDPAYLNAVETRWAQKCDVFKALGAGGAQATADLMGVQSSNEWSRWASTARRYTPKGNTFQDEVTYVQNWYAKRYAWMNGQLESPASVAKGC